ncbi:hypothetical protein R1flu_017546 [Riccia fluitans]|uniref:Uncharacterized protein n=1 Tax=Riccia fluitans TaxID=41844 RepID=A0ABD1ZDA0_9MARC
MGPLRTNHAAAQRQAATSEHPAGQVGYKSNKGGDGLKEGESFVKVTPITNVPTHVWWGWLQTEDVRAAVVGVEAYELEETGFTTCLAMPHVWSSIERIEKHKEEVKNLSALTKESLRSLSGAVEMQKVKE